MIIEQKKEIIKDEKVNNNDGIEKNVLNINNMNNINMNDICVNLLLS